MQNLIREFTHDRKNHSAKINKAPISHDVYSITHDLRAPLMSIKGLIHLLKSDLTKEQFSEYLHFLDHSVNKMDASISRIIDYSKDHEELASKESEELALRTQEINFNETIDESLRSLRYMPEIDSVHITVSAQESGAFISDNERLLSIFSNVISNAVRYRDKAKNSFLHVDVSFRNRKAILVFVDNGIGIEEAFQHRIFNKLFRVSHDHRGSGLGLHIVQTNVNILKGEINVQSTLGEGTTFTIEIPTLPASNLSINCD